MFKDREHAGKLLAAKVGELIKKKEHVPTLVIGLPRGGVPVAKEVASELHAELSILVSKKIGAPFQPEFAIGAVTSAGVVALNEEVYFEGIEPYIESERLRLKDVTKQLEKHWFDAAGLEDGKKIKGKRVVLVDDGIATGMTTLAAVRSVRSLGAKETIVATPVISIDAQAMLSKESIEVLALMMPFEFLSISCFYKDFHQVEDDEVIAALKSARLVKTN